MTSENEHSEARVRAIAEHLIPESELLQFGAGSDWVSRVDAVSRHQFQHSPLLVKGHATLAMAQVKHVEFDGFEVRVQYNPGRLASVVAPVDTKALQERKCFLCLAQLPAEQRGVLYGDYLIVCNPFPILDEHFTVPHVDHRPQRIRETFGTFLSLVFDLGSKYTLLYNGPRAGASAPDHLHFQAGTRGWMPIDNEYARVRDRSGVLLSKRDDVRVWAVGEYLRSIVAIEGRDPGAMARAFDVVYESLQRILPGEDEPMMNLIAWSDAGKGTVTVIPRARHRPSCFSAEGQKKIIVSPGSVDMGGVLITPLPESFERLNPDTIAQIMGEVSLSADDFARLQRDLRTSLVS